MRNRFERQLQKLNEELTLMGTLIERAIASAAKALLDWDKAQARQAIEFDREVDEKEKEIERLCLKLLLQQQPVASDLRLISAALKMITDMERIGDQAADISEITLTLDEKPPEGRHQAIAKMARATIGMVTNSIDAFVRRDLRLAQRVVESDDEVDALFDQVRQDLIDQMRLNAQSGEQAVDMLMVAKYFERIGDHAENIAEWVVFSITGEHAFEN